MAVRYRHFQNVRVSRTWYTVLTRAQHDGVRFKLNSGHRTMREQWALFRQNMVLSGGRWVRRTGRPLTAFPSPLAPHVRVGRADHALDVDSLDGGETRLQNYLTRHGADAKNTVPGESWHLEVPRRQLRRLARRISKGKR